MSAVSYSKAAKGASFIEGELNKAELGLGGQPLYFKNHGLFSENYLINHLGKSKDPFLLRAWETEDRPAFSQLYEWMLSTWDERKDDFETMKEAQLEEEWIRPILQRLGWEYVVQPDLTRHGKRQIPDYALFDDISSKKKASKSADQAFFAHCSVVADAKAMPIDLDGKALDNTNPSFQIMQYLTYTNKDWGILTNGRYWRLYSLKSKTKFRSYFEVNIEKFLSGNTREDERFKYFYNFFSRDAFAEKNAGNQSFIDVVFSEGEQYAQQVETELKERAFELVGLIANGFAQTAAPKSEEDLKELYSHSLYYLFRLIFILNCEAKGLLNIGRQNDYFKYSLRNLCGGIKEESEKGRRWANQAQSHSYIKSLFKLLASGDSNIGIHGFGQEIYDGGFKRYFEQNEISDVIQNDLLLRLSCEFDKKKKAWSFIDYQRLSVDHMGSIFEGLLEFQLVKVGTKINLVSTSGERKTTGSYYTPDYIVDYIVKDTLAPQVKGLSNADLLKIKVVDPAMGSAHFLLGAVKFIEEIFLENLNDGDKSILDISNIRWEILHNCIYGSDINPLAVELAKFSLWMFTATNKSKLEKLDDQFGCADSLLDSNVWKKLRPTNGFDAVVGNPPYVRQEELLPIKDRLKDGYKVFHNMADLYSYFVELGHNLAKADGRIGLIISNKWMKAEWGLPLRSWLRSSGLERLVDFGDLPVFKGIAAYPCILTIQKGKKSGQFTMAPLKTLVPEKLDSSIDAVSMNSDFKNLDDTNWTFNTTAGKSLNKKIAGVSTSFGKLFGDKVFYGIKTGLTEAFVIDTETGNAILKKNRRCQEILKPFALGRDVHRYEKPTVKKYIIFVPKGWTKERYKGSKDPWTEFKREFPEVSEHLEKYEQKAKKRSDMGDFWWEIRACDYYEKFEKPKIAYLRFQVKPHFTLINNKMFGNDAVWFIESEDKFLLGYLNSKVGWHQLNQVCTQIRGGVQILLKYLSKMSVPEKDNFDKKTVGKIEAAVEKLLSSATENLELQNEVDDLFYQAFNLTKAEIEEVESFWPKEKKKKLKEAA